MAVVRGEEGPGLLGGDVDRHRHRLGRGGALVEQARVGDRQSRQVRDHRLEVEQQLERPWLISAW
jgi:hypothetical protein